MRKKQESQLVSTSTILILSGFLIGLTVGKSVTDTLSPFVLDCGLAGLLAFIALEFASSRREEEEAQEEQDQIQSRLDRHIMSISHSGAVHPEEKPKEFEPFKSDSKYSSIDQKRLDALYERLMKIDASSDSQVFDHEPVVHAPTKVI